MKNAFDYENTGQAGKAEDDNVRGLIGQTMSPNDRSGKVISTDGPKKEPKPGKAKVIPLRQEDIDLCQGDVKRKRVMVGFVVVLSVVLGLIILRPSGLSSNRDQIEQKTGSIAGAKAVSDLDVSSTWKVPDEISKRVRDITKSSDKQYEVSKPKDLPELPVRGIVVYGDNNKSAIIGDMVVKVGDTIKGVKIYMITADSVEFEKDGVRWSSNVE